MFLVLGNLIFADISLKFMKIFMFIKMCIRAKSKGEIDDINNMTKSLVLWG